MTRSLAPLAQWVQSEAEQRAFAEAEKEAEKLVADHAARLGIELERAEVEKIASGQLEEAVKWVANAYNISVEAALGLTTREAALAAYQLAAELVAHEKSFRRGDELSLLRKYFPTARSSVSARPASTPEQEAIGAAALRKA